jgi:predicted Zn finger-like uncharacterized protein
MLVTCPRCFATYNVPEARLGNAVRKVRCSDCRFEWSETPPPQEAIAGLAPEPMPDFSSFAPPVAGSASDYVPPPVETAPAKTVRRDPRKTQAPARDYTNAALWTVFLLVTGLSLLVLLREPLGKATPWLTDFYETIGLPVEGPNEWFAFKGIVLEKTEADGQTVLIVRGQVHNQSRHARNVPPLRLFWREKGGNIGPSSILQARPEYLAPGEAARFSGDLIGVDASAGGEVKVTFVGKDEDTATAVPAKPAAAGDKPVAPHHSEPPATPAQEDRHAPEQTPHGH